MAQESRHYTVYRNFGMPNAAISSAEPLESRKKTRRLPLLLLILVLAGVGFAGWRYQQHTTPVSTSVKAPSAVTKAAVKSKPAPPQQTVPAPAATAPVNHCASNTTGGQLVLVSISDRHMWACDGTTSSYDSPVVTGIAYLAADKTPTGTYHIYSEETDLYLSGSDSTGSWHDYVYYWMPWLHNQYGSYGFHDATWRDSNAFGNISANSSDASHGCVELPLSSARWLYHWAHIGTAVTVEA